MVHDSPILTEYERQIAMALAARATESDAEQIIAEVAELFGVQPLFLKGPSRDARIVDARAVVTFALEHRGWTNAEIGHVLNRDRTTVYQLRDRLKHHVALRKLAQEFAA